MTGKNSILKNFSLMVSFLLPLSLSSVYGMDDPNLNPHWDWTKNVTRTIFLENTDPFEVRLPFFKHDDACDMDVNEVLPEKGWFLLHQNFGGPGGKYTKTPTFWLYNRHSAIIKIFYYGTEFNLGENFSHGHLELSIGDVDGDPHPALFTWAEDIASGALNKFDVDNKLVSIHPSSRGWNCGEFIVAGYDPLVDHNKKVYFMLEVNGVNITDVELELTGDLTQKITEKSTLSKIGDGVKLAGQAFSTAKGMVNKINDWTGENPHPDYSGVVTSGSVKGDFVQSIFQLSAIGGSAASGNLIGAIAGGAGFLLGGLSGSPPAMNFSIDAGLKGKLTNKKFLDYIRVRVPGATGVMSHVMKPLYEKPLGLFNLTEHPVFFEGGTIRSRNKDIGFLCGDNIDCRKQCKKGPVSDTLTGGLRGPAFCGRYDSRVTIKPTKPLTYVHNYHSDMKIISIRVALVSEYKAGLIRDSDWVDLQTFNEKGIIHILPSLPVCQFLWAQFDENPRPTWCGLETDPIYSMRGKRVPKFDRPEIAVKVIYEKLTSADRTKLVQQGVHVSPTQVLGSEIVVAHQEPPLFPRQKCNFCAQRFQGSEHESELAFREKRDAVLGEMESEWRIGDPVTRYVPNETRMLVTKKYQPTYIYSPAIRYWDPIKQGFCAGGC